MAWPTDGAILTPFCRRLVPKAHSSSHRCSILHELMPQCPHDERRMSLNNGSSTTATAGPRSPGGRVRVALLVLAAWSAFTGLQLCVSAALPKAGTVHWGNEIIVDLTMAFYWTA